MPQVFVQPSNTQSVPLDAAAWYRAIPVPGVGGSDPVPAINGIATCRNLVSDSPPVLGNLYRFYSYSIGWGVFLDSADGFTGAPNVTVELALLVNDDVAFVDTQQQVSVGDSSEYTANGVWVSDLVNPINVGPRDRLTLRTGLMIDQTATDDASIVVGGQYGPSGTTVFTPWPSSLSYDVLELPGRRRL